MQRLHEPLTALEGLAGWVVLDEVQRLPALFPILRVLADRPKSKTRFLLLGSASFELIQRASDWREDFSRTFVERDIFQLGAALRTSTNLRKLWTRVAHRHGQLLNVSDFASSLGKSAATVKNHLKLLGADLMIRQLQPWHANTEKRIGQKPQSLCARQRVLCTHCLGSEPSQSSKDIQGWERRSKVLRLKQ